MVKAPLKLYLVFIKNGRALLTKYRIMQLTGLILSGVTIGSTGPSGYVYDSNQQGVYFTTPGSYTFTVPSGVHSVSVVCVGAGGGSNASSGSGGGGGLGWKNNISVTPGQQLSVVVGAAGNSTNRDGGASYFINTSTVAGFGGLGTTYNSRSGTAATYVGDGGGDGGAGCGNGGAGGGANPGIFEFGGGGAGGYAGAGGNGGGGSNSVGDNTGGGYAGFLPITGSGGGGGGGYQRNGGGVGIYGKGADGNSRGRTYTTTWVYYAGTAGSGGSGQTYGGGAGGPYNNTGGDGAVRIIWGAGRSFPSNAA